MRFPKSFIEYFGFTKSETRVIIFLLGAFLVGGGIKLYEFYFQSAPENESRFDYTDSDREFQERASGLLKSASSDQSRAGAVAERSNRKVRPAAHSININTAPKDRLMALPGIGEELAERIILYREDQGPFATVEELKNVKGIAHKKFEQLRSYITLD